jgi:polysaccharide deacetylase family protein (PEP-CTERM system associated)
LEWQLLFTGGGTRVRVVRTCHATAPRGWGGGGKVVTEDMRNALTVDLEDYYHVTAFADRVSPDEWGSYASRVESNTQHLLDLFAACRCSATFFTLGWVAERYSALLRGIIEVGHEIACHSHSHRLVYSLSREEFREDTRKAKCALEDACGRAVVGYRAPSFSITSESLWAFEILAELGFRYDSSVFPVRHPNYGIPRSPRFPYVVQTPAGDVVEFPLATLAVNGRRSPFGGGAYLRFLPEWYTRWAIGYVNSKEAIPVCVYLHPWEIDPHQPKMRGSLLARIRHYVGLGTTERKLTNLLRGIEFRGLGRIVEEMALGTIPAVDQDSLADGEGG